MKLLKTTALHLSDLLVYILLPVIAICLPAALSRRMVRQVASWQWVLRDEASASYMHAAKYTAIEDEQEWKDRWRLVVLLDARDLYLLTSGRSRAVLAEIEGAEQILKAKDRVLVGMHWGPSIAILALLRREGLNPLLVYRQVERYILQVRPFYYHFLRKSINYILQNCQQRAIPIRGAGHALRSELARPGTAIIVLDAPPVPGRSTITEEVLGHAVCFNAGFPEILQESRREYIFYAISLTPGRRVGKVLEMTEPQDCQSPNIMLGAYCAFLGRHLGTDSAQWRIWRAADQFFQPVKGVLPTAEGHKKTPVTQPWQP
jgi:hypothetical protein